MTTPASISTTDIPISTPEKNSLTWLPPTSADNALLAIAQQNQQNAVENMLLIDCALHPAQQVKHLCVMRQLHFFLLRRIPCR